MKLKVIIILLAIFLGPPLVVPYIQFWQGFLYSAGLDTRWTCRLAPCRRRSFHPAQVAAGVVNTRGRAKYRGLHALRHFYVRVHQPARGRWPGAAAQASASPPRARLDPDGRRAAMVTSSRAPTTGPNSPPRSGLSCTRAPDHERQGVRPASCRWLLRSLPLLEEDEDCEGAPIWLRSRLELVDCQTENFE
jgi:hypothetical protein